VNSALRSTSPPDPCEHEDPAGCSSCPLCRRGLPDPGGRECRRCLRGIPVSGRGSGPVWHVTPLRLDEALHQKLRERAEQEERPIAVVVRRALRRYLSAPSEPAA
jgi:hypothetical protein